MKKKVFNFEIYVCNQMTGETGWDIKQRSVFAESKEEAKELIAKTPFFDCIILYNYGFVEMSERDIKVYSQGCMWRDVEYSERFDC